MPSDEESLANFGGNVDLVLKFFLGTRGGKAFLPAIVREAHDHPQTRIAVSIFESFFLEILQDIEITISFQCACSDQCANFFLDPAILAETLKNCQPRLILACPP